jgi:hypothetical protein
MLAEIIILALCGSASVVYLIYSACFERDKDGSLESLNIYINLDGTTDRDIHEEHEYVTDRQNKGDLLNARRMMFYSAIIGDRTPHIADDLIKSLDNDRRKWHKFKNLRIRTSRLRKYQNCECVSLVLQRLPQSARLL